MLRCEVSDETRRQWRRLFSEVSRHRQSFKKGGEIFFTAMAALCVRVVATIHQRARVCERVCVRTRERSRVRAHAHAYAMLAEAADRVRFLQERGFRARTVAVLAMPDDTAASIGDVTPQPPGQG